MATACVISYDMMKRVKSALEDRNVRLLMEMCESLEQYVEVSPLLKEIFLRKLWIVSVSSDNLLNKLIISITKQAV